jgi:hypothetical protein
VGDVDLSKYCLLSDLTRELRQAGLPVNSDTLGRHAARAGLALTILGRVWVQREGTTALAQPRPVPVPRSRRTAPALSPDKPNNRAA